MYTAPMLRPRIFWPAAASIFALGLACAPPPTEVPDGADAPQAPATDVAVDDAAQDAASDEGAGDGDAAAAEGGGNEDVAAAELAAYEAARPAFDKHCAICHTKDGKFAKAGLNHFDMTSYPFGGHHADEVGESVRVSLGATDNKATMPRNKPGSVEGDDLELILAWADAFAKTHPAGEGGHDD